MKSESTWTRGDLVARILSCCVLAAALAAPSRIAAELPDTPTLLAAVGLTSDEIAEVEAGNLVRHSVTAGSDRELTTALAFQVRVPPKELIENARQDLLDRVDQSMRGYGRIGSPASPADFAKLSLSADEANTYRSVEAGGDLNLSSEEIATFQKLGSGATTEAVEEAVREALVARVEAYRSRGLDGIAPYDLGGEQRSPAAELRIATKGATRLAKYAPEAHGLLLTYPNGKPPDTEEIFRWSHFEAHGEATIALNHLLLVPDGEAFLLIKRQLYVSMGYNAEQATAAFLPSKGGTVVVYATRTSTDQVTGFGGSAKRSIGSKLLASQLETLFEKAREQAK